MQKKWHFVLLGIVFMGLANPLMLANAATQSKVSPKMSSKQDTNLEPLYKKYGDKYDVPWSILAGIDRYAELTKSKQGRLDAPFYGFALDELAWAGLANPLTDDYNPSTIRLFGGLGVDANGDGLAAPFDPPDRIAALANWLDLESGEDDFSDAVWNLFQDPVAMDRVFAFARIFQAFGLHPQGHCFPINKRYNYSVKHTFGAGRSFGGRRIHEGVDIFASYGTPVLACSYAYVELLGWNRFGGWRIGLRDGDNYYYYYAHLSSFAKGLKQGDIVQPGQVIGYVGSTGYGPPGTAGKFPPHLHFGIYKDTGLHEWAFSPSGLLASWERQKQRIVGAHS
jgi:murein DD-endopeptidase MepM/ murein hydrolase activator NlpD